MPGIANSKDAGAHARDPHAPALSVAADDRQQTTGIR